MAVGGREELYRIWDKRDEKDEKHISLKDMSYKMADFFQSKRKFLEEGYYTMAANKKVLELVEN